MKYSLSAKNMAGRNLEAKASYCVDLINSGQCKGITGILRTDSGLQSADFNRVISNSVMPPRILQRFVVEYFSERQRPFSLWHCASKPLDDSALTTLGLCRQAPLVAMVAEVKELAVGDGALSALDIQLAHTAAEVIEFGQIAAGLQDIPHQSAQILKFYQQLAVLPEHKRNRLKLFIGKWQGELAACGNLFSSANVLGFYDLGTLGPLRGRGIGTALFQHLVAETQASHHKYAVALVAENQQNLYLNVGFYAVGELARYDFIPQ